MHISLNFIRFSVITLACVGPNLAFAANVRLCTDRGAIDLEIDEVRAPLHAANFLRYTNSGFYDGTVIHRVVPGSMVQAGSYDLSLVRRAAGAPVANESANGLSNLRGTIAASRSADPNSATSQFFINLADNTHLDAQGGTPGYTVFGRVTAGLEALDRIAALPTRAVGELDDVPNPIVEIMAAVELERAPVFGLSLEPDPEVLERELQAAQSRGDPASVLRAVEALKRSCTALTPAQRLAEADAAAALGRTDLARYGLDRYLATASQRDPGLAQAQALYAEITGVSRTRNLDDLIGQCRPPIAPTVSSGRFLDRAALAATESAVQRFRSAGGQYLDCVRARLARGDLNADEERALVDRHNDMVVEITAATVRFNRAVESFREANALSPR